MFRNHRLRSRIAVAGAVLGASLGTAAIAGAATTKVTAAQTPASLSHNTITPGYGGLGSLLQAMSQVKTIKGTQFGYDLSSLATAFSNEDGVSYTNYIDGLNHLQAESASFPAPFNELFYNMAASLLKDAQP